MRRNNSPLLCRCPIFETSATALCGTNYWNAHWVGGRPMISQPCLERDRLRDLDLELRGIFPRRRSLLVADRWITKIDKHFLVGIMEFFCGIDDQILGFSCWFQLIMLTFDALPSSRNTIICDRYASFSSNNGTDYSWPWQSQHCIDLHVCIGRLQGKPSGHTTFHSTPWRKQDNAGLIVPRRFQWTATLAVFWAENSGSIEHYGAEIIHDMLGQPFCISAF